ncbi:class I adenylate-forming enzyme family protein [Pseudoalteromonas luteoviolacea]|uniref:class I adenylate-forming enzyme family protein n=1 Tax=Pseudoalteromonas luteoviolacea TaxID=43657 RepID=UPI00115430ED|nr:class I adenylate-forming enzyme family protein [Pseudoalteromonas luteoviolacea]TQF72940.1 acyl--CoA ligase [Pseudoalteromonas luteoviolacea]
MQHSLGQYFLNSAQCYPQKTALICERGSFTYTELLDQVTALSNLFIEQGIKKGDRIVICTGNTFETVVSYWAVLLSGACVAVVSDEQPAAKIAYIIENCSAKVFIATASLANEVICQLPKQSSLECLYTIDSSDAISGSHIKCAAFPDSSSGVEAKFDENIISEDLASLVYTSGSTGEPKGVTLTHANMCCALDSLNTYLKNSSDDVFLNVLPLSFDYGLYQMIMAFSKGATLVLEKDLVWPLAVMKKVAQYKCTVLPAVPVLVELFEKFNALAKVDFSTVRCVTNTGAALRESHISALKSLFSTADIYSMYGLTECKRCTYLPPEDLERKPGSVGIAIPNTEIMVLNDNGTPCIAGEVGQLVVRGGTVMRGYWNNDEATNARIKEHPIYGGKCLFTGDYGYLDEDGYFYFKGRMDEVLKVRGKKLIPKEIEETLVLLNEVEEASVICLENPDSDPSVVALVTLVSGSEMSSADLKLHCTKNLEVFQVPTDFYMLKSFPRNQNGKIDKPQLRKDLEANSLQLVAS